MTLIRFILTLVVVTVLMAAGVRFMLPIVPTFLIPTSVLLFLVTVTIYRYLYRQKDPQFFIQIYLATMAFKILAYCGYVLTMALLDKPGAFPNVLYFLCVYVIFTALEVGFLYRKISNKT